MINNLIKKEGNYVCYVSTNNLLIYSNELTNGSDAILLIPKKIGTKLSNNNIELEMSEKFKGQWFFIQTKDRIVVFGTRTQNDTKLWHQIVSNSL